MSCNDFTKKIIFGLTVVASTLAQNIEDNSFYNNEIDNDDMLIDDILLVTIFGLTVATASILCARACLSITNGIPEDFQELQTVGEQNRRTEIVDTRDITDVEVEVDDSNSDITIVVYAKNIQNIRSPRVADISRF